MTEYTSPSRWDFTRSDARDKTPASKTRTYHWEFSAVRVIMPPIQPVTKKRPAETALAPAPRREMKFRKLTDVLGIPTSQLILAHHNASPSSASSSSPLSGESSSSTTPTSIALTSSSNNLPSSAQAKTVKKNAGRAGGTSKKGKEKESDFEQMEEDM